MNEREIQQLQWDNNKYIRALREICMTNIQEHSSYKDAFEYVQRLAHESVGGFEVRKYE